MPNLWEFEFQRAVSSTLAVGGNTGYTLPILVAGDAATFTRSYVYGSGGATVNVLHDFLWTNSKKREGDSGREEVPYAILTERKVTANSLVAQAIYSAGAVADTIKAVEQTSPVVQGLESVGKSLGLNKVAGWVTSGVGALTPQSMVDFIKSKTAFAKDDENFLTKSYLKPYKGLYITQPTGWRFVLPFFQDIPQAGNTWASSDNGTSGGVFMAKKISEAARDIAEMSADLMGGISSTGTYVENSQFYQYQSSGESVTIKFPLINTGIATYDDVVKNWQFIFLLLYNNRPERVNRNLIEPPPLYEINIPGGKYMPLAYIQSINVEYKGSRRQMSITVPDSSDPRNSTGTGNKISSINTIIPEVYEITIQLTGLVTDSKNFMFATIDNQTVSVNDITERPVNNS